MPEMANSAKWFLARKWTLASALKQHANHVSLLVLQALNVIPIRSPSLTAAAEATVQRVSAPCSDRVHFCRVLRFPVLVFVFCSPRVYIRRATMTCNATQHKISSSECCVWKGDSL